VCVRSEPGAAGAKSTGAPALATLDANGSTCKPDTPGIDHEVLAMTRILSTLLLSLSMLWGLTASAAAPQAAPGAAPQTVPGTAASQAAPGAAPAAAASASASSAYSAIVPVAGTSDAQRDAAMSGALAEVLHQVSPTFVATPDVLAKAASLVRDFHYQRAPTGNGLMLDVDFDPGSIDQLVSAALAAAPAGSVAATPVPAGATPAGQPAAVQSGNGAVWVDGIDNGHAFASLLALLRGDPALHDVVPVAAQGDGVLIQLGFDQPLANVLAGLTGPAGHLAAEPQPHPGANASLRWVP
jgi:Uncharacterized protein conserved in bacteria (DUF2066)